MPVEMRYAVCYTMYVLERAQTKNYLKEQNYGTQHCRRSRTEVRGQKDW